MISFIHNFHLNMTETVFISQWRNNFADYKLNIKTNALQSSITFLYMWLDNLNKVNSFKAVNYLKIIPSWEKICFYDYIDLLKYLIYNFLNITNFHEYIEFVQISLLLINWWKFVRHHLCSLLQWTVSKEFSQNGLLWCQVR